MKVDIYIFCGQIYVKIMKYETWVIPKLSRSWNECYGGEDYVIDHIDCNIYSLELK